MVAMVAATQCIFQRMESKREHLATRREIEELIAYGESKMSKLERRQITLEEEQWDLWWRLAMLELYVRQRDLLPPRPGDEREKRT